ASGPAKPNRARSRRVAPAPIRPVPGALGGRSPLAHAEHAEGLRSRSRAARSPPQPVPLPSGPLPSYLLSRLTRIAPPHPSPPSAGRDGPRQTSDRRTRCPSPLSRLLHLPLDVTQEAANRRGRFALYEGPNQTLKEAGHRGVWGDRLREAHP